MRTHLGIIHWQPVGVDAALLLELSLERVRNVLWRKQENSRHENKMKQREKERAKEGEKVIVIVHSPAMRKHKPLSRELNLLAY